MFTSPQGVDVEASAGSVETVPPQPERHQPAPVGIVVVRLAAALATDDVMYIATDEQRGTAVAAALSAAAPDALILHLPSTETKPNAERVRGLLEKL